MEGLPADRAWIEGMIDASAPGLPDSPSPEQLAAWMELQALLGDRAFLECKRVNAADAWAPRVKVDRDSLQRAMEGWMSATSLARSRGASPTSTEAATIVDGFMAAIVAAATAEPPAVVRAHMRAKFDPRGARFWELVGIMKGDPALMHRFDDWRWFGEAMHHHLDAPH